MNVGPALTTLGLLGILGLTGCGGVSGNASVSGTDPNSIRNAPAGVSVLVFIDLESIRPDQVQSGGGAGLPAGVTVSAAAGVTTFTFTKAAAADGGVLDGTVTVTGPDLQGGTASYTETFNLTSTTTLPGPVTQTWTYKGAQKLSFNGTSATLALADPAKPILAAFTDSATPAKNKTYQFSLNNLNVSVADPARLVFSGGYGLVGDNGDIITCAITQGDPLVWTISGPSPCQYPTAGGLALALTSTNGNDETTANFNAGCGSLVVNGVTITLGGS